MGDSNKLASQSSTGRNPHLERIRSAIASISGNTESDTKLGKVKHYAKKFLNKIHSTDRDKQSNGTRPRST